MSHIYETPIDPFFLSCLGLLKLPGIETLTTFLDGENAILRSIYLAGGVSSPLALSNDLRVSKGRIAQLIKSLMKKKLIKTKINRLDRRKVEVRMSPLGENYLAEKLEAAQLFIDEARKKLGDDLFAGIIKIIDMTKSSLGGNEDGKS